MMKKTKLLELRRFVHNHRHCCSCVCDHGLLNDHYGRSVYHEQLDYMARIMLLSTRAWSHTLRRECIYLPMQNSFTFQKHNRYIFSDKDVLNWSKKNKKMVLHPTHPPFRIQEKSVNFKVHASFSSPLSFSIQRNSWHANDLIPFLYCYCSLVPGPLPVFQCCTRKLGVAWGWDYCYCMRILIFNVVQLS